MEKTTKGASQIPKNMINYIWFLKLKSYGSMNFDFNNGCSIDCLNPIFSCKE